MLHRRSSLKGLVPLLLNPKPTRTPLLALRPRSGALRRPRPLSLPPPGPSLLAHAPASRTCDDIAKVRSPPCAPPGGVALLFCGRGLFASVGALPSPTPAPPRGAAAGTPPPRTGLRDGRRRGVGAALSRCLQRCGGGRPPRQRNDRGRAVARERERGPSPRPRPREGAEDVASVDVTARGRPWEMSLRTRPRGDRRSRAAADRPRYGRRGCRLRGRGRAGGGWGCRCGRGPRGRGGAGGVAADEATG